ncbi:MAG: DmsC/YnfH family molybdoenzyme membrane anchor subunit [Pseudomonadota bacterium]|nr:DmsC/YnfH family molybdoenzyme membrane anchor subunit [Pseudomonadota bacterium]
MRPAASLIIFTTLSGLGLGLAVLIGLGQVTASSSLWVVIHAAVSLGLIGAGVISSTLHLGHPERAWRAMSQWRSSWLSREGVMAGLTTIVLAGYFLDQLYTGMARPWLGIVVSVMSLITIYTTAMIYASLKTIARWHHILTPVVFILLALAGGCLLGAALQALAGTPPIQLSQWGIGMIILASLVKIIWWHSAGKEGSGSTPESATGLGALGQVRMIMPPHTEENWLQHEMGFVVARKHAVRLAVIALVLAAVIPLLVLGLYPLSAALLVLAAVIHMAGIMVERWLFFAEAKHTITLYYGDRH